MRSLRYKFARRCFSRTKTSLDNARLVVMFTGQGSQYVGMGNSVFMPQKNSASIEEVKKDILANENLAKLLPLMCHANPTPELEKELTITYNAQPAILSHGIALWRELVSLTTRSPEGNVLQTEKSIYDVKYMLGHSLGEFTALTATGALSLRSALELVYRRGKIMHGEQQKSADTEMAALIPCTFDVANSVVEETSKLYPELICNIANVNSPQQVVISGHKKAVTEAIKISKEKYKVKRAMLLNVSAPFHSKIMQPAATIFAKELERAFKDQVTFATPVISNVTAKPMYSTLEALKLLPRQMYEQVRWFDSISWCIDDLRKDGANKIVLLEIGPKSILLPFAKSLNEESYFIGSLDHITKFIQT